MTESSFIRSKKFKVILAALALIMLTFYLIVYLSPGIYFNDIFLKRIYSTDRSKYIGYDKNEKITVTTVKVDNIVNTKYYIDDDIYRIYNTYYERIDSNSYGITIEDDNQDILFQGFYNKKGISITRGNYSRNYDFRLVRVGENNETKPEERYKIPIYEIADHSLSETVRGRPKNLVTGLLIFLYVLIDYKFPDFFFALRYIRLRNSEKSEIHIFFQNLSWIVLPIVGMVYMVKAVI